ncbi:MAG: hypothetical protein V7L23_13205 [Nostoc sp.]|uniref:hypothetical protein n=1 Tax=Nostoc sp. TaxID=1180 RepID=UPI002FF12002
MSTSLLKIQSELEAQLQEIQEKLAQVRSVTPTLTSLEVNLDTAFQKVSELGMLPTLLELLTNKAQSWGVNLGSTPTYNATVTLSKPTSQTTSTTTPSATPQAKDLAGERAARARAKEFTEFTGSRLTAPNTKLLLLAKLSKIESSLSSDFISDIRSKITELEVSDPEFWSKIEGVIEDIEEEVEQARYESEAYESIAPQVPPTNAFTPTTTPETALATSTEAYTEAIAREIQVPSTNVSHAPVIADWAQEALTVFTPEPPQVFNLPDTSAVSLPATPAFVPAPQPQSTLLNNPVEDFTPVTQEQVQKGAILKNEMTGVIGTVEISGFITALNGQETISIRYPAGVAFTPSNQLSLLVPAPSQSIAPIQEQVETPTQTQEFTPEDLEMIAQLGRMGNTQAELNELMIDPEILEIVREKNPQAQAVSISNLYEWMTGKPAITSLEDVRF